LVISFLFRNQPATAASLLRLYWFRLGDALLPVGVALLGAVFVRQLLTARPRIGQLALAAGLLAAGWQLVPLAAERLHPGVPRADGPGKVIDHADWVAACEWIRSHTPAAACFLTPRSAQTFKWYAQRAEVVTWKDIPQKPDELVEWWRRMHDVNATGQPPPARRFFSSLADEGAPRLRALGRQYGAQFVLTSIAPPLDLPRIYANKSYAVYVLPAGP
jgi:asparagine N-glycosylation enzyme membrane subunit Stt3